MPECHDVGVPCKAPRWININITTSLRACLLQLDQWLGHRNPLFQEPHQDKHAGEEQASMLSFPDLPTKPGARPALPFSDLPDTRRTLKQRVLVLGQVVLFIVCIVQVRLLLISKIGMTCGCH